MIFLFYIRLFLLIKEIIWIFLIFDDINISNIKIYYMNENYFLGI